MPGPAFVPITLGERTFQVRRKHAWGTYKVLLPLNEKIAAIGAQVQSLQVELLKITRSFPLNEAGDLDTANFTQDQLDELGELLPRITGLQAQADKLMQEQLDVQVDQAEVMLGTEADDFFALLDDVDMDEAIALIRRIANGQGDEDKADDLDPETTAEAAGLPLDGSTGASPPPTQMPSQPQPGEVISSGSALTQTHSLMPTPQPSSSPT